MAQVRVSAGLEALCWGCSCVSLSAAKMFVRVGPYLRVLRELLRRADPSDGGGAKGFD